jgi:hypothetical protein
VIDHFVYWLDSYLAHPRLGHLVHSLIDELYQRHPSASYRFCHPGAQLDHLRNTDWSSLPDSIAPTSPPLFAVDDEWSIVYTDSNKDKLRKTLGIPAQFSETSSSNVSQVKASEALELSAEVAKQLDHYMGLLIPPTSELEIVIVPTSN